MLEDEDALSLFQFAYLSLSLLFLFLCITDRHWQKLIATYPCENPHQRKDIKSLGLCISLVEPVQLLIFICKCSMGQIKFFSTETFHWVMVDRPHFDRRKGDRLKISWPKITCPKIQILSIISFGSKFINRPKGQVTNQPKILSYHSCGASGPNPCSSGAPNTFQF